ncbi:MAG TPA: endolytic transglycosylase MltG [Alphaproteobacteria bacterium]|nr:endolytic transglycosylase MltG [Alphaproteobacteria bacterium]
MSIFKKITLSFTIFITVFACYCLFSFYKPGPLKKTRELTIPKGTTAFETASLLEQEGVIEHAWVFAFSSLLTGNFSKLKAGEYSFSPQVRLKDCLKKIVNGKILRRFITIPEGWSVEEAVNRLNQSSALTDTVTIFPPEGSLLPDTYDYKKGESRIDVLLRMQQAMTEFLIAVERSPKNLPYPLTLHEIVVLASVIEKETSKASERAHIASVFFNRLLLGMPLQSDPTVIYAFKAAGTPLKRSLLRVDLKFDSPYNTYTQRGLPPSAIACPSKEAILAVLSPFDTKDLYFVADGTGGHTFSSTLEEHTKAVKTWYKLKAKK